MLDQNIHLILGFESSRCSDSKESVYSNIRHSSGAAEIRLTHSLTHDGFILRSFTASWRQMKAAAAAAGIQTEEQRQIYKNQETFIINLCERRKTTTTTGYTCFDAFAPLSSYQPLPWQPFC